MGSYLFLVETSEKAERIKSIAGEGHGVVVLEQLPASYSIGGGGAGPSFQPIGSVWSSVVEHISKCSDVYYGFDTSMDGEYLSYLVDQLVLASGLPVQRHRLNMAGLTAEIFRESLSSVEPIDDVRCLTHLYHNLFHKVFFSHLSRLLGTAQGPGGVELSIATLTCLSMLAEKHESLQQVGRQHKWELEVRCQQDGRDVSGRLVEVYGVVSDGVLDSAGQVKEVAETLKGGEFTLVDRAESEVLFPCPTLYTLPELVFDAYRFYQILPGEVMSGLTELFTGVDLGSGKVGLISSPHGVSVQNMQPVFDRLGQFVTEQYGNSSSVKKECGDGVILPLNLTLKPGEVKLVATLAKLYELIWSRSVASQMADGAGLDQKMMFETDGKRIQFSSLTLVQQGFLSVFKHGYEAVFAEKEAVLSQESESVIVSAVLPKQMASQGLGHYQISSLCEDLREMGFDDEKQILSVFQQMVDHHYVLLGGAGEIMCTETLLKVVKTVDRAFPGMKGLNLTAYYGQTVEEVVSGRKRADVALKQFDQNLVMQGKPLVKVKVPVSVPKSKRKSKNVIKGGKGSGKNGGSVTEGFGDFNADTAAPSVSEGYDMLQETSPVEYVPLEEKEESIGSAEVVSEIAEPAPPEAIDVPEEPVPVVKDEVEVEVPVETPEFVEIDDSSVEDVFTQPLPEVEEEIAVPEAVTPPVDVSEDVSAVENKDCPECGRVMVVKDDRFGKFWSCTGMPACHHSEPYKKGKEAEPAQPCPVCKRGILSVNRTPAGKVMYVCNDPACEFMAWAKPHAIDCPLCGSPFLIQKKDRMGNVSLRCPVAGCSYVHGGLVDEEKSTKPKKKMVRVRRKKSGSSSVGKKRRVVRRKKK